MENECGKLQNTVGIALMGQWLSHPDITWAYVAIHSLTQLFITKRAYYGMAFLFTDHSLGGLSITYISH